MRREEVEEGEEEVCWLGLCGNGKCSGRKRLLQMLCVACEEEHYHFVLDISGNRELMEGHRKAGQFVQVSLLPISLPAVFTVTFGPMSYSLSYTRTSKLSV